MEALGRKDETMTVKDNKYISDLWWEYEPYIRLLCVHKLNSLPDYADDCVQDVFLALYDALSNGKTIQYPKAWLTRVANNKINDAYKKAKKERERHISLEELDFKNNSSNAVYDDYFAVEDEDILILMENVTSMLNEKEKQLLNDRYKLKKSISVIAKEQGTTENNIYQKLFRLKQKAQMLVKKVLDE